MNTHARNMHTYMQTYTHKHTHTHPHTRAHTHKQRCAHKGQIFNRYMYVAGSLARLYTNYKISAGSQDWLSHLKQVAGVKNE